MLLAFEVVQLFTLTQNCIYILGIRYIHIYMERIITFWFCIFDLQYQVQEEKALGL